MNFQLYLYHFQLVFRILQDSPQDVDAFKCKILAMIHQSAFNDVVTLLNKNPPLSKGMVFEKAYAGEQTGAALLSTWNGMEWNGMERSTDC